MVIRVFKTKDQLGKAAVACGAEYIRKALRERGAARIIVATGASQFEMLAASSATLAQCQRYPESLDLLDEDELDAVFYRNEVGLIGLRQGSVEQRHFLEEREAPIGFSRMEQNSTARRPTTIDSGRSDDVRGS